MEEIERIEKIQKIEKRIKKLEHNIEVKECKILKSIGRLEQDKHYCARRELKQKLEKAQQKLKELERNKGE